MNTLRCAILDDYQHVALRGNLLATVHGED